MKVMVLGYDGYIGFPLTQHLLKRGHEVFGVDNGSRRQRVKDLESNSLTPITDFYLRKSRLASNKNWLGATSVNIGIANPVYLKHILQKIKPDAIVHLAEQPSAPWSMKSPFNASITQQENVLGTLHLLWAMKDECPEAHLVKLGTMGEYGTPECDIPEGIVPEKCLAGIDYKLSNTQSGTEEVKCPLSGLLFPRSPGSFYHLSKVHDTHNIHFACNNWGLRSTDIMQGVVFGLNECKNELDLTRFDYDECFGTAINRFCAQALADIPLTVYGSGNQTRGFLPLKDSIQCLTIALEKPPELGEYRTLNQFESIYSINDLADMVAKSCELTVSIQHLDNPRKEAEKHYYNPDHDKLFKMGYKPTTDIEGEIIKLLCALRPYKDLIKKHVIMPRINWR